MELLLVTLSVQSFYLCLLTARITGTRHHDWQSKYLLVQGMGGIQYH